MIRTKTTKGEDSTNTIIYIVILSVFVAMSLGTAGHEIFHSIVGKFLGFNITDSNSNLMTGSTNAVVRIDENGWDLWLFFTLPSILIFLGSWILTLFNQSKLIITASIILMFLNLASLNPEIQGSDAQNAVQSLISQKILIESDAFLLQYIIFGMFFTLFCLYIYISIDNNSKDVRKRIRNIYR